MSRGKTIIDHSAPATLQVRVGLKVVLQNEKTKRMTETGKFVSMAEIVAEALSAHLKDPEYDKILKEAGLLE